MSLYDGDSIEVAYTIAKTKETKKEKFKIPKVSKEEKDATKNSTIKDRLIVMNGETSFIRKADPAHMGVAATSLLPQDFAGGFMEDPANWNIVGNEEVAGVQTVVIEGTLDEYYSSKYNGGNFKLNVDPNTGILLQMEVRDKAGELKRSLKTSSIKINGTLDESSFVIE
ncbi:hypothetical protein JCM21738_5282 [Mesobacillus boroniphilus JCM 21738]|uniref:Uncharacterized protein n=1 Tax=Mesobacillus boroniphilus JCM 21738 TaxID=1294265 RepID=W4RVP1_9BACI|nr:hypothetical protein JCM21738_5282 [Mesobacillus boroniphilus JCM 21738]